MILTVTLNAALDITHHVDRLRPHAAHRVHGVAARAGGKGVNVSRVLHALGHPTLVTGLAGGGTGAAVRRELHRAGIPEELVPVVGETRRTVAVVDASTGDTTTLLEPGPVVLPEEWSLFREAFGALLARATVVVLSGSLPPGLPDDAYAVLVRAARARGVPALLDTSGPPLLAALPAGPTLVKPNADELTEAATHFAAALRTGPAAGAGLAPGFQPAPEPGRSAAAAPASGRDAGPAPEPGDPHRAALLAAEALLSAGAGAVVASLGGAGMVAVTVEGAWRARPPERLRGNPTGAGDAAVAALALGIAARDPWPVRLAEAVALSAAAVAAPLAGSFAPDVHHRLRHLVDVAPLPRTPGDTPCPS
ncbi:1-phosphofructokinase family hexose kinase [Streptomyces sp. NPDC127092]|uniref:1-phosphofructokinase family hexose kinase n=1 Tax=Streptomyces sp. NPDC127092 TaxID=3347135 RepID=UPI0036571653